MPRAKCAKMRGAVERAPLICARVCATLRAHLREFSSYRFFWVRRPAAGYRPAAPATSSACPRGLRRAAVRRGSILRMNSGGEPPFGAIGQPRASVAVVDAEAALAVVRAALRRLRARGPLVLTRNLTGAARTANAATARRVQDAHVLRRVALGLLAEAARAQEASATRVGTTLTLPRAIGRIAGAAVAIAVATVSASAALLSVGLALRLAASGAHTRRALVLAGELGSTATRDRQRHGH